jgi:integrase
MCSRIRTGSVVQDKRDKVWRFFWWENGKRRSRALGRFPTKATAWKAAKPLRDALEAKPQNTSGVPTVSTLVEQFQAEKMPERKDTHRTYQSWIRVHILPKWGQSLITDLQARPVEMWLDSLSLAPKSRGHIRGILSAAERYSRFSLDMAKC